MDVGNGGMYTCPFSEPHVLKSSDETPSDCDDTRILILRRIFIWRDRGSRNNPAFMHESVIFGGGGVLAYGGISIDGRIDLYIIRVGPLTARRYRGMRSLDLL
ncbi:transposable element Tcb2 transposase [Trichonephila clavipes]|nr:transposable element Tcb2 transposase [Trichonephila clavipes]